MPDPIELRFVLTPTLVESLERRRHSTDSNVLFLHLALEPTVIGPRNFNHHSSRQSPSSVVWDEKDGEYAEIAVFWATNHLTLKVDVNTSTWVDVILPGLGYDRLRLVEVTFPPALPDQPGAAAEFDRARHALDSRHYEECVAACHGLLSV